MKFLPTFHCLFFIKKKRETTSYICRKWKNHVPKFLAKELSFRKTFNSLLAGTVLSS